MTLRALRRVYALVRYSVNENPRWFIGGMMASVIVMCAMGKVI